MSKWTQMSGPSGSSSWATWDDGQRRVVRVVGDPLECSYEHAQYGSMRRVLVAIIDCASEEAQKWECSQTVASQIGRIAADGQLGCPLKIKRIGTGTRTAYDVEPITDVDQVRKSQAIVERVIAESGVPDLVDAWCHKTGRDRSEAPDWSDAIHQPPGAKPSADRKPAKTAAEVVADDEPLF